jgi:LuxR family maltose regulon positive regulatory protein
MIEHLRIAAFRFIVTKVPNIRRMSGSSMARTTPYVEHDLLSGHGGAAPIAVGSPAWFAWLEQADLFAFRSGASSFTARRESRARGGGYWRAYRTIGGRQRRAYLGRAADLTSERLHAAAIQLSGDTAEPAAGHTAPPAPLSGEIAPRATSAPLLATKLYLPRPRGALVPRPQLLARLAAGMRLPLTLIAAPAGFGKTTLLAQGLENRRWEMGDRRWGLESAASNSQLPTPNPHSIAWLSLDDADNDPRTFLRYLIAALRRAMPSAGTLALALMDESQPPPPATLLTTLINDLAEAPQPVLLALDDYHVIRSPAVHDALAFLLDHRPENLHLVIGSREDPPLPLARLRARRQIAELRAADLRFSPEEAAAFLQDVMGLELDAEAIATLEARTEGWIAGLQLAALAMQDRADQAGFIAAFAGSNRFVIDYLASEVLDRLPDHMRAFMLRTSILERMCGPLCDAVADFGFSILDFGLRNEIQNPKSKIQNSQFLLEELERANLFLIPLDDQRRWYRYHQLLAGMLRERLRRELDNAQVAELHRRASTWFEQAGLPDEATQHALAAHDFARAADLIEHSALAIALEGRQATVAGWLAALPDALRRERPRLVLAQAGIDGLNGDFAAAAAQLQQAEQLVQGQMTAEAIAIHGEIAAMRTLALGMIGDPHAMAIGRMALAQLPDRHPMREMTVAGLCYAAFYAGDLAMPSRMLEETLATREIEQRPISIRTGMVAMLAMVRRAQGRLEESRRMAEQALALANHAGRVLPLSGTFLAYLLLGLAQCEQNQLDAAEHTLRQCAALAGQYQMSMNEILARFYLGQALAARGDLDGALGLVEQAEAAAQRYLSPRNLREIAGYRVLLWLKQGNLSAAAAWAATYARETGPDRPRLTAYDYDRFALAQTLIAQGQLDAAHNAVLQLIDDAEATGHGRFLIWSLVLHALILDAQGERAAALNTLQRALALAEPHGYVRMFVNHGAPIGALLREAHARGMAPAFIERLLHALPDFRLQIADCRLSDSQSTIYNLQSTMVEELSAREREVLGLLANGMDNSQIAQAMSIAISTVKAHINHIFGKLGVRSRLEAVLRAQELELL